MAATRTVAPRHQGQPGADAQAQAAAAQAMAARARDNRMFLERTIRKYSVMPPSGGSGNSQNYVSNTTLEYDVKTGDGAYLEEILLVCNITATLGAGTSATYALNAAAPYSLFDTIEIQYGGTQARLRPFILKTLKQLAGWQRNSPAAVLAGNSDSEVQDAIWSTLPVVAGSANTWTFYLRVPLRFFPHMVAGFLPIQSDSTPCQVKVICATNPLGNDPILNVVSESGGSGGTASISGTVQAIAVYRDGTRLNSRDALTLDLTGEPTAQAFIDRPINNLAANLANTTRIDTKLTHMYGFLVVVDGQNATKYADRANITGFAVNEDSNGQNKLVAYGKSANNNVPMMVMWEEMRGLIGQDLDEGIIPFAIAPIASQYNPSNGLGLMPLEMGTAGWPDANLELWLNTVGTLAGMTPRAETYLFSLNGKGLVRNG